LLERNLCHLEARDANGNCILHYLAGNPNLLEAVRLAIEQIQAERLIRLLYIRNRYGCTPMHVACYMRNFSFLYAIFRLELPIRLLLINEPKVTGEGHYDEPADLKLKQAYKGIKCKITDQNATTDEQEQKRQPKKGISTTSAKLSFTDKEK